MKRFFAEERNGYLETIQEGLNYVNSFRDGISASAGTREDNLLRLKHELETADAVLIGAGAGLSTSAGLTYSGKRFHRYFYDFEKAFGIQDMYSGGFYPFPDDETRWAWWARHIYFNRYVDAPRPVYQRLKKLAAEKEYFVITTNVDHQFQRAGFDKQRLFYTQGDYGLFQTADGRNGKTYDNEAWVMQAMEAQGFVRDNHGTFDLPQDGKIAMRVPHDLIPKCPDDGSPVAMNLRADDSFVEDEGWRAASRRYAAFLDRHRMGHILYLELGVGANTPVIIKYPFWAMTERNPKAVYACLNYDEACCPKRIERQSICINGDADEVLSSLAIAQ